MQDSQGRQHRWPLRPSIPQRSRSGSRQHSCSRSRRQQPLHQPLRRLQLHRRAAAPAPCRACSRASTRAASWLRAAPRATSAPGPQWSCPRCRRGGRWRRRRCPSSSSRCTCGGSSRALPRRSQAQNLPQCNRYVCRCLLYMPRTLLLFLLHIATSVLNLLFDRRQLQQPVPLQSACHSREASLHSRQQHPAQAAAATMLRHRRQLSMSRACPGPLRPLQLSASPVRHSRQWQLRRQSQPGWQAVHSRLGLRTAQPLHSGVGPHSVQSHRPAMAMHRSSVAGAAAAAAAAGLSQLRGPRLTCGAQCWTKTSGEAATMITTVTGVTLSTAQGAAARHAGTSGTGHPDDD